MASIFCFFIIVSMYAIYEYKCEPLAMTVPPNDTTVFYYQNATIKCIFNKEVNCIWKQDGVIVTMSDYVNYYYHISNNGKNTMYCSITLYTVSEDYSGDWSCENEVNESQATLIKATVKITVQACGIANEKNTVKEKIVGGEKSTITKYPWIVTIHNKSKNWNYPLYSTQICHGTLISRKWMTTAAHCVYKDRKLGILKPVRDLLVFLEPNRLLSSYKDIYKTSWWRDVCEVVVHYNFDRKTLDYDIALMKLSNSVEMLESISPICLPPSGINYNDPDIKATLAGFGTTDELIVSPTLEEITVPVISFNDCWRLWNIKKLFISPRMICGGQLDGRKTGCYGDSGSGFMYQFAEKNEPNRFVLLGIYSGTSPYCSSALDGSLRYKSNIFTKVDEVLSFIDNHIHDELCPEIVN